MSMRPCDHELQYKAPYRHFNEYTNCRRDKDCPTKYQCVKHNLIAYCLPIIKINLTRNGVYTNITHSCYNNEILAHINDHGTDGTYDCMDNPYFTSKLVNTIKPIIKLITQTTITKSLTIPTESKNNRFMRLMPNNNNNRQDLNTRESVEIHTIPRQQQQQDLPTEQRGLLTDENTIEEQSYEINNNTNNIVIKGTVLNYTDNIPAPIEQVLENQQTLNNQQQQQIVSLIDHDQFYRIPMDNGKPEIVLSKNNSELFRNYVIIEKIGQGGFGVVMKCREKLTQHEFAVKIIRKNVLGLNEVKTLVAMKSPFIIDYKHSWIENDNIESETTLNTTPDVNNDNTNTISINKYLCIKMDLANGSLHELITMLKSLYNYNNKMVAQLHHMFIACELFKEIAQGINYLHSQIPPILHLDLKPRNILILISEPSTIVCKICDFGLAVHYIKEEDSVDKKPAKQLAPGGTPAYMAPEGLIGGVKADIFSFGVVLRNLFDHFVANEDSISIQNVKRNDSKSSHSLRLSVDLMSIQSKQIQELKKMLNITTHGMYNKRPLIQQIINKQQEWDCDRNNVLNNRENIITMLTVTNNQLLLKLFRLKCQCNLN
ncbi:probable serine/threonine-protein kinase DDB_G0271682 [Oppia nitens]|uniref:probable serine/threonine-protein kinase DDB_G0271682 n=1 Tax=Oppia nitens TaxID=1686743 RepID=UPI0023DA6461|nr:probable serine/threonine-protein kinase DDB_G0271682 [Oppia nitens]